MASSWVILVLEIAFYVRAPFQIRFAICSAIIGYYYSLFGRDDAQDSNPIRPVAVHALYAVSLSGFVFNSLWICFLLSSSMCCRSEKYMDRIFFSIYYCFVLCCYCIFGSSHCSL